LLLGGVCRVGQVKELIRVKSAAIIGACLSTRSSHG
jgi:hypothetical protein